jgi:peptidoglycan DL-endopeptidase CwlO
MWAPLRVRRSVFASILLGASPALALTGGRAEALPVSVRVPAPRTVPVVLAPVAPLSPPVGAAGTLAGTVVLAPVADAAPVAAVVQPVPPVPAVPAVQPAPFPPVVPGAQPVQAATSVLGTPYRWGGSGPGGFDCSGLIRWAWAQAGVDLPHSSAAQRGATRPVGGNEVQPGDLVFYGRPVSHVAMYVGDGMIVHSPHSGDVVKVAPLGSSVGKPLVGFGRVK